MWIWLAQLFFFCGIPNPGQLVILRAALDLLRRWDLRNNKWVVIKKIGCKYRKRTEQVHFFILLKKGIFFNFITSCTQNFIAFFYLIQIYFEIIFNLTLNFGLKNIWDPIKMLGILLNFFERLAEIINKVLARKWAVILTNCKWVVVNSIRIEKWVVHYYKSQMSFMFSATHLWA